MENPYLGGVLKIAVAGGFGFLGSHIVSRLKEKGFETVPFSRRNGIDIRIPEQINSFLRENAPEVVINCAAHVGGISYNTIAPVEIYEDNLLIGFNLMKACYSNSISKLVNVMPNCTYPGDADVHNEDRWWDGAMHESVLAYGMPRKALWVHGWVYRFKHGFNSIHIILPNLYGPADHFDPVRSHALGALIKKVMDAKLADTDTVEIWGTGTPVREWMYVEDAADGVITAMEKYNDIDIINVGMGKGYTIKEIAEVIKQSAGWEGEFRFDPTRPDGAPSKIFNVSRMKKLLGWEPRVPIIDGISATIEWYVQNMTEGGGDK